MVALTAGQRHESPQAIPLLEQATGRMWPEAEAGDKGDNASDPRNWLQEREIAAVIPSRDDELGDHAYDREAYREFPSDITVPPSSRGETIKLSRQQ